MPPRFPSPPWLRDPPHRTLAEVAEAWQLQATARNNTWHHKGWEPAEGRARLAELHARAVEPERDTEGAA